MQKENHENQERMTKLEGQVCSLVLKNEQM